MCVYAICVFSKKSGAKFPSPCFRVELLKLSLVAAGWLVDVKVENENTSSIVK